MFRIIKISGESLTPEYREGDFVLLVKIPFLFLFIHPGDIIVLNHASYGRLIKRVEKVSADRQQIFVIGSHPSSIDSRQFGPIARDQVLGKVIWHIPSQA